MKVHMKRHAANSVTLSFADYIWDEKTSENVKNTSVYLTEEKCTKEKRKEESIEENGLDESTVEASSMVNFFNVCEKDELFDCNVTNKVEMDSRDILSVLFVNNKKSVAVVGPKGCGKSTVINVLARSIRSGNYAGILTEKCTAIYKVNVDTLAEDEEGFVSDINYILAYAKSKGIQNVVIYLDDICKVPQIFIDQYSYIMDKLSVQEFNMFKFIFEYSEDPYVTETEVVEIAKFFKQYSTIVEVKSPDDVEHILSVMALRIKNLEDIHGVYFEKDAFKFITVYYYGKNFMTSFNYNDFLDVIDEILSNVQVTGRKTVVVDDIKRYYKDSFQAVEKLPKDYVRATAVHETGHILLSLYAKKMLRLRGAAMIFDFNTGIEAVTCIEKNEYTSYNIECELLYVAMILAGRVAEIEYYGSENKGINLGAEDDVKVATEELRNWVLHSGAYQALGYQYHESYKELPSKAKRKVDKIVAKLMKKSFKKARKVVKSNKKFVKSMSKYLSKNIIATFKDIKKIEKKTR